jgi:hypothetical protein
MSSSSLPQLILISILDQWVGDFQPEERKRKYEKDYKINHKIR